MHYPNKVHWKRSPKKVCYCFFGRQKVCYRTYVEHNAQQQHEWAASADIITQPTRTLPQRLTRTQSDGELPLSFFSLSFFVCDIIKW